MADYKYFVANNLQYYWPDLDDYKDPKDSPQKRLFKAIIARAWDDLTWDNNTDDIQMLYMKDAYHFFIEPNPVTQLYYELMGFAEEHINKLKMLVEEIFKANYVEPSVKEWKRRGRKPRGYQG